MVILLNFTHAVKDQGTTKHFTLDKDRQARQELYAYINLFS